jgi:hypothetical protein
MCHRELRIDTKREAFRYFHVWNVSIHYCFNILMTVSPFWCRIFFYCNSFFGARKENIMLFLGLKAKKHTHRMWNLLEKSLHFGVWLCFLWQLGNTHLPGHCGCNREPAESRSGREQAGNKKSRQFFILKEDSPLLTRLLNIRSCRISFFFLEGNPEGGKPWRLLRKR